MPTITIDESATSLSTAADKNTAETLETLLERALAKRPDLKSSMQQFSSALERSKKSVEKSRKAG